VAESLVHIRINILGIVYEFTNEVHCIGAGRVALWADPRGRARLLWLPSRHVFAFQFCRYALYLAVIEQEFDVNVFLCSLLDEVRPPIQIRAPDLIVGNRQFSGPVVFISVQIGAPCHNKRVPVCVHEDDSFEPGLEERFDRFVSGNEIVL
jgi:hypothetical protein